MKKYLVLMSCIVFVCCFSAVTHATLFTFDDLISGKTQADIELYMEDIYGSNIVVVGAVTSTLGTGIGNDTYLANNRNAGFRDISIAFVDVPIVSVSLDWQVFEDTGPVDFAWSAYDESNTLIEYGYYNTGKNWGTSPLIVFSQPISIISFSNDGVHDIGIDNLYVNSVPEPATILLVGTGLLGIVRLRKKTFSRKNVSS